MIVNLSSLKDSYYTECGGNMIYSIRTQTWSRYLEVVADLSEEWIFPVRLRPGILEIIAILRPAVAYELDRGGVEVLPWHHMDCH